MVLVLVNIVWSPLECSREHVNKTLNIFINTLALSVTLITFRGIQLSISVLL